jgi:DNA-binding beta-propeller fold protein YncE
LVDAERNQVYVSNINGKPTDKDGNGFISIIKDDGSIQQLKWVEGLNAPKGMTIVGENLFVTDIDRVAIINIEQGKIINLIDVPGAKFLNDMVADNAGKVYISDMNTNQILLLEKGKISLWLGDEALVNPNGLAMENGKLLVGCRNYLLQIDPETKKINFLVKETGGIDGLIPIGNNQYVISDWSGKIQLVGANTVLLVLQNTTEQQIQAADLGFIEKKKIILIPTFFDNRVSAMKLNLGSKN